MSNNHRVIYVSAAHTAIVSEQLDSILAVARRNNEAAGVSGLLLFYEGSFFQVLEGPKDAVTQIFAAIRKDHRHSMLILLENRAADLPAFPNWPMGYFKAHELRPTQKAHLVDLSLWIGREGHIPLSFAPTVSAQINAFLGSFREFAEV